MRTVTIKREKSEDWGTPGSLETDLGFKCRTLELPWRDNIIGKSCIPPGKYPVKYRHSPKHGMCYHVDDVPGRTVIEIHSANYAGDESKGLKCQLLGCVALGARIEPLAGQMAITSSRSTLDDFEKHMEYGSFELEITEL